MKGARHGNDDRERALEYDGVDRDTGARMNPCDAAEKEAVAGHRVINPGRQQDCLTQKPNGGNSNPGRDNGGAGWPQRLAHNIRRGAGTSCESASAESTHADEVDAEV